MSLRDKVLGELERCKGTTVSGSMLANRLAVSRTAVWKAIEELRAAGYPISATPNRGYVLEADSNRLSETAVRQALPLNLQNFPLYVYDTLESTNQTAKQLALDGAADGTVVIADHQTGGRGRRGRSFFSPPDVGLYLTMILRTSLPAAQAVQITTAASVAAARAIEACSTAQVQIKWINDLYVNGRKICGILTDGATNMENGSFEYVVVGIGINVNTAAEQFPPELQETATSVYSETNVLTDRNRLAAALICHLRALWDDFTTATYMDEYRERSCVLGRRVRVFGAGYEGDAATAEQITDEGHLIVRLDDGTSVILHSGEITIRPEDAQKPFGL